MDIEATVIAGQDICPCGSGEKYGDCCLGQGISYGLFECEGKRVIFNVEETNRAVENLLRFLSDEISALYDDGEMLHIEKATEKLGTVYELLAKSVAPFAQNSPCQKGCTPCCHHIIETTPVEAEMVRRSIEKHLDHSAMMSLVSRIKKNRQHYPPPVTGNRKYDNDLQASYFEAHMPCPFLSEQGACMIYEARPLLCRMYMVFSDPELCRIGDGMATYEADYYSQVYTGVQSLSLLVYRNLKHRRHLPDWFVNEFNLMG
jgi:Fe-S-cluster containining protein